MPSGTVYGSHHTDVVAAPGGAALPLRAGLGHRPIVVEDIGDRLGWSREMKKQACARSVDVARVQLALHRRRLGLKDSLDSKN